MCAAASDSAAPIDFLAALRSWPSSSRIPGRKEGHLSSPPSSRGTPFAKWCATRLGRIRFGLPVSGSVRTKKWRGVSLGSEALPLAFSVSSSSFSPSSFCSSSFSSLPLERPARFSAGATASSNSSVVSATSTYPFLSCFCARSTSTAVPSRSSTASGAGGPRASSHTCPISSVCSTMVSEGKRARTRASSRGSIQVA